MRGFSFLLIGAISLPVIGQTPDAPAVPSVELATRPAEITTADLKDFDELPEARRRVIEMALSVLKEFPWLPYTPSGSEPASGGFDCSGAIHFVLSKVGLKPPRSSAAQFEWLQSSGRMHQELGNLKPGDLIFWSRNEPTADEPEATRVHHVAMYLGTEKKDGRPVMINATDGRSYRGQKANGYGVYDFVVPKEDSLSKIAGYGTPPGISE